MKKRMLLTVLIAVALIIAGGIGIPRYMSGSLKLDHELFNDENFNILADNWEKIAQDSYAPIPCEGTEWIYLLGKGEGPFISYYVNMGDAEASNPFEELFSAKYDREYLWSKKHSSIFIGNQRIAILYMGYEVDSGAEGFENWFRALLESVQAEE